MAADIPEEVYVLAEIIIDGVIDRLKDMAEDTCEDCPLKLVNTNPDT